MIAGYQGNNLLPARAGELLRVYFLTHFTGKDERDL